MADAAASCARYLAQQGWHAGLSTAEKRRVIWQYNRSNAYIDTILALDSRLRDAPEASVTTAVKAEHPSLDVTVPVPAQKGD
jgi:membrane-bound lytic murein transglycosylase B